MDAIQVSVNFKIYLDNGIGRHADMYREQRGWRWYNEWNYTTIVYYMFSE